MFRRPIVLLSAVIVCTVLVRAASAADPQLHQGTVVSAGSGRLVMKDEAGKEQSFTIEPATKITVNGKPGKLEDLQATMPVQVMTDQKGMVLTVSTIDKEKRRPTAGARTRETTRQNA